jgi:hypothetical protein
MFLSRIGRALVAAALAAPSLGAAFFVNPWPTTVVVKEYINDYTHHFVLLADPAEIAGVEQGQAGPGWRWTGYVFYGYKATETNPMAADAAPVCRFYAPPPTNSHFFTANAAECEFLKTHDTGWIYEKVDFKIGVPVDAACGAGLTPIYRAYNNRWTSSDSNHRFTPDERIRTKLLQAGWADEGIAFCANGGGKQLKSGFWITGTDAAPTSQCGDGVAVEGSCAALHGLPDMREKVERYLPPYYSERNPAYSMAFADITGWVPSHIDTVYSARIADGAARSYVEWVVSAMPIGIHVNGHDRIGGDYASISPTYRFSRGVPAAPGAPASVPVLPWGDGHDHDLLVTFQAGVKTVRRGNAQSHAYGHPLIDFRDTKSGEHVEVTLQTYGTQTPGDFVGRDAITGQAIVSTVFRDQPLFGTRLQGTFIPCHADAVSGACDASGIDFSFRIDADDFAKVLALARGVNPALSANPADYAIENFQFRNETFRDAEIGLVVNAVRLTVTY